MANAPAHTHPSSDRAHSYPGARTGRGRALDRDHHGRERALGAQAKAPRRSGSPRRHARASAGGRGGPRRPGRAARRRVEEGRAPRDIDENAIGSHLYAPDMPEPDLLIRTSGELRVSNFLLWQLAYTELVFVETLLPDFGAPDPAPAPRPARAVPRRSPVPPARPRRLRRGARGAVRDPARRDRVDDRRRPPHAPARLRLRRLRRVAAVRDRLRLLHDARRGPERPRPRAPSPPPRDP